jgi:uncharacterized protein
MRDGSLPSAFYTDEDGDEESEAGLTAEVDELLPAKAAFLIPACVEKIATFWRVRRSTHAMFQRTLMRRGAKIGRDQLCPCGSG